MELTIRQLDIIKKAIGIIAIEGFQDLTTKNLGRCCRSIGSGFIPAF